MQEMTMIAWNLFFITMSMVCGVLVGLFLSKWFRQSMHLLYILCGGLLVGILLFELVPESLNEFDSTGVLLGASFGIMFIKLIDQYLHKFPPRENQTVTFTYMFLLIAVSLHNIPTGLVVGLNVIDHSFNHSSLVLALFIHHLPEGIMLAISALYAGYRGAVIFLGVLILNIILALSMVIGMMVSDLSLALHSILVGGAIGTLSFVAIVEMLWKPRKFVSLSGFMLVWMIGLILTCFLSHS